MNWIDRFALLCLRVLETRSDFTPGCHNTAKAIVFRFPLYGT
jgi:hypothetical protein